MHLSPAGAHLALRSFVPLVLYWICGEDHLRLIWRLTCTSSRCFRDPPTELIVLAAVGLGIVPAGLVLLWRLRMPLEPTRYRTSAIKRNVPWKLVARKYWCVPPQPSQIARGLTMLLAGAPSSESACAGSSTSACAFLKCYSVRQPALTGHFVLFILLLRPTHHVHPLVYMPQLHHISVRVVLVADRRYDHRRLDETIDGSFAFR